LTHVPFDMRVLAAIRPVDAMLRTPVRTPLEVTGDRIRVIANRSGLYVIAEAPGTDAYTGRFALPVPPAAPQPPAVGSVQVTLSLVDPAGRYLPRTVVVQVPRDPDPAHRDQPGSLFMPIDVDLFPSPTMALREGWATVRVSVKRANSQDGLPFAFVRVRRASDNVVLGRGVTDERGEAMVGIPGIPVTTWNAAPGAAVTASSVAARVAACFDKTAFHPETSTYPDPTALEQAFATLPHSSDVDLDLTSGREVTRRIDVTVPP
jgi:hypothetical protein